MSTSTAVDVRDVPALGHEEAMRLFAEELQGNLALMRRLSADDWTRQTDCPDWDVRRLYLHVLGAAESGASVRELLHQTAAAWRRRRADGVPLEAALSGVQVQERLPLTAEQLVVRFAEVAPRCVRARTRLPALLRKASMTVDAPVVERWTLGYLVDVIYLRDAWMHRIDACRATGAELQLDEQHDGRIVADVVAEWARRHGQPFALTLTGPAGGRYVGGSGAPVEELEIDAVEFCRALAGRVPAQGLLATVVPF